MVRIARKLKADKRTKRRISVLPEKTQAILYFDQITLKMKLPEAKRIAEKLSLAVEIMEDRKTRPKREELRII